MKFPEQFFITGTDTGIGKTFVSAMLMSNLDATYWKPVQAGLDEETDTEFVQRISGADSGRIIPETYRLKTPMSPHAAADIDEIDIELSDFKLPEFNTKHLIVEGAGGLIVPLNWKDMVIDLIEHLNLPVVLVARSSLGTLNHTLLSLKVLHEHGIEVCSIIMNGDKHPSNKETIEHFGNLPVYEVEPLEIVNRDSLIQQYNQITHSY